MGSSFIHLIRTDSNEFFLTAEYYSMVYMYHSFLIHSSAMCDKNHYNIVISLQLIKINGKKKYMPLRHTIPKKKLTQNVRACALQQEKAPQ